jgi:uncharacterized protein YcnI
MTTNAGIDRARTISWGRRLVTVVGVASAALLVTVEPALADPARPTNYRSEVTTLSPATPAVDARVVGGDAFLEITVDEGSEVVIFGYGGEPYVRIDPTGLVWVNTRSPAHYLNDDRYAQSAIPSEASVDAEPQWEETAAGGRYAWHDHRIHWMSPQPPPGVDQAFGSEIMTWAVPIEVDGSEVNIMGQLRWVPSESPLPWVAFTVVALGGLVLVQRFSGWSVSVVVMIGAIGALVVGGAETFASPLGAGGEIRALGPPALALVLGMLAFLHPRTAALPLVGGLLVGVWAVLRVATLWMPQLPTELPPVVERAGVALALAAAVAAVVAVVRANLTPPLSAGATAALVLAAIVGLPAAVAHAHTEPDLVAVPAGAGATITLQPTHGCAGSPTVEVVIRAPVEGATPGEVVGWVTSTEPDGSGNTILTWTGGRLPTDATGAFPVTFVAPDSVGELLLFPAIQICENGEELAWISGDPLSEYPAPRILVLPPDFEPATTIDDVPPDAPGRAQLQEVIDTDHPTATTTTTATPTTTAPATDATTTTAADSVVPTTTSPTVTTPLGAEEPTDGGSPVGWLAVGALVGLGTVLGLKAVRARRPERD